MIKSFSHESQLGGRARKFSVVLTPEGTFVTTLDIHLNALARAPCHSKLFCLFQEEKVRGKVLSPIYCPEGF